MAKYAYPAIFVRENDGGYSVSFPDIDGCFTCGDTLPEAMGMAADALGLMLYDWEEEGEPIPEASSLEQVRAQTNELVSLVYCDMAEYREHYDGRPVEKTLTIPNWLNTLSERAGINFSFVLQEALKEKLEINFPQKT